MIAIPLKCPTMFTNNAAHFEKTNAMMNIHDLPLDVLFWIGEYLSPGDLTCLSEAFDSMASAVTKRVAIKAISALLVTGQVRHEVLLADNGAYYKVQLKHPRAGPYRHREDHIKQRSCGGIYQLCFLYSTKYKRTFYQSAVDDTKTEMIVHVSNGKSLERCTRKMIRGSHRQGPAEMVETTVMLSQDVLAWEGCGVLHLHRIRHAIRNRR